MHAETGHVMSRSSLKKMPFKFEYHPGYRIGEEPEGITWWDLDSRRAPSIRGQLHVIMLDTDPGSADDMYLKHNAVGTYSVRVNSVPG